MAENFIKKKCFLIFVNMIDMEKEDFDWMTDIPLASEFVTEDNVRIGMKVKMSHNSEYQSIDILPIEVRWDNGNVNYYYYYYYDLVIC